MNRNEQSSQNFQKNWRSLLENAEDLFLFLSSWVDMRSSSINYFKDSTSESSPASNYMPDDYTLTCPIALGPVKAAITNKIHTSAISGCVATTLGNVATLGAYSGYKRGKNEKRRRRINIVAEHLSSDIEESKSLEEMVMNTMQDFSTMIEALKVMVDENSSAVQRVSNRRFFLKWCEQMNLLIKTFLSMLKASMEPSMHFARWNMSPIDGGPDKHAVRRWVKELGGSVTDIDRLTKFSDQVVRSVQDLIRTSPNAESSKGEVTELFSAAAGQGLMSGSWTLVNTSDCLQADSECGDGIEDLWVKQIDFLFSSSVKVAHHIIKFLTPENLPKLDC